MKTAIIRITGELLADLLKLPPGVEIMAVSNQSYFTTNEFALKVVGENLPVEEHTEGKTLPELLPQYTERREAVFAGFDTRRSSLPADILYDAVVHPQRPRGINDIRAAAGLPPIESVILEGAGDAGPAGV